MVKRLFVVLMVAASLPALAEPEIKGNPSELRQFLHPQDEVVTIYGEAEEKAYTDKAVISLVITTEDKLLAASIEANSKLRERVTKQLVKAGIAGDDIKSSKFSTSPQYGWFGKKPDNYKVVNRMAISITDERHLKEVAAIADIHPEIELSNTVFEHTQKDKFKEQVKLKALDNVMKQKAMYERNLGVKLVPVGFKDTKISHVPTQGAAVLEEVVVRGIRAGGYSSKSDYAPAQSREASFDEIRYQASISVDFKITK